MSILRLGTRGSPLALYQARTVAALLQSQAGVTCEIVVIRTSGDRLSEAPLADVGGKRLFVKEIEDALLANTIDIAVHSSKDMSAELPGGLAVGAALARADARDALLLQGAEGPPRTLGDVTRTLGSTPRIGTSSVRRSAQLRKLFPQARFELIRGNLDTRLRKLDAGEYDAIVLAAAGLTRLGYGSRISCLLSVETCIPAPGQGIIAVEIRGDDLRAAASVRAIADREAIVALAAEREVVLRLGGGCQMPLGAYATTSGEELTVKTQVLSLDGQREARAETRGAAEAAVQLGALAAERLLAQGAAELLIQAAGAARRQSEGRQP